MVAFFCNLCTWIYVRIIHNSIENVKKFFDILDFEANIINGRLQILIMGCPFTWGLKYKKIVSDSRRLIILANGPSLNEDIDRLSMEDTRDADYAMVNFSATEEIFFRFKPKYYCLADHMFFREDHRIDRVRAMFESLNKKVDWEMTLFVTYHVKKFVKFSKIDNPNITIKRVYPIVCEWPVRFSNWLMKNGSAIPGSGTVTNVAAYAGIQMGYKQIEFCGNDMSFFDGLCINDENETCTLDYHFYDNEMRMKPYIDSATQKAMSLESYISMVNRMVHSHNRIAEYGKHMGVSFVNRTRRSMLDCYPRLIKVHPEEFLDK